MSPNDLTQDYRALPTPQTLKCTYIFKGSHIAHDPSGSPVGMEATEAPCHSSRKAEGTSFSAILDTVYHSSRLGVFKEHCSL